MINESEQNKKPHTQMKKRNLDFSGTDQFKDFPDLLLLKPIGSILYRAIIPDHLKTNEEFIQVCNTLSVNNKPIRGTYYFKANCFDDFKDLSETFAHMGIDHFFVQPDSTVNEKVNPEILN